MPRIKAPDGSTWKRIDDDELSDNEEIKWVNTGNRDAVTIRNEGEREEKVPESEWVGPGGATRNRWTEYSVEYPDGLVADGFKNLERAAGRAKEWMGKYPNESGGYGPLR